MYSSEALRLRNNNPEDLARLQDRVTFLYFDRARITQDRTGVLALFEEGGEHSKSYLPTGSLAVLLLGPGTSVSAPALGTIARSGATVVFVGEDGAVCYTSARALTSSGRFAQAQARLWADPSARLAAAHELYRRRFPGDEPKLAGIPLRVLRGMEGRRVKAAYREAAASHRVIGFKRVTVGADDPVNVNLNLANAMLYGCAAAVCAALAVNPALGIIHHGDAGALIYDLADVFKVEVSIPAAFAAAGERDFKGALRRNMREALTDCRVIASMFDLLLEILEPFVGPASGDELLDDDGFVPALVNYHLA